MNTEYAATPAAIDAGLMLPSPEGEETRVTPLGLFCMAGFLAFHPEESASARASFDGLISASKANGFKLSGELRALFASRVNVLQSPRMLKLCRQAVNAIGPGRVGDYLQAAA